MKTFRFIGMALLALVLCVNLTACSDDDDDNDTSTLNGTSWEITNSEEDADLVGVVFSFSHSTVTTTPTIWDKITYTMTDNTLKMVFEDDDYIEGNITINGNTATYRYHWADFGGGWSNDEYYTMTLKKR